MQNRTWTKGFSRNSEIQPISTQYTHSWVASNGMEGRIFVLTRYIWKVCLLVTLSQRFLGNNQPSHHMILRYTLAWFALMVVAIANGTLRELVLRKFASELTAHQLSCLTGVIMFGLCVWGLSRLWPLSSATQAWAIGLIWLSMTIAFEFGFGHFFRHFPWSTLLHDYNVFAGRLWIFILLWVTISPYIFFRMKR
jgi:hypothetical protein